MRVLVADDEAGIRFILAAALRGAGLDPVVAADGAEAVRLFRDAGGFAAVLLDVMMPGLDGPTVLAALRETDPGVRVVFMTGAAGRYTTADLLRLGAVRVLDKPFPSVRAVAALVAELARAGHTS